MTLNLARLSLNLNNRAVRRDLADPYDMHRTLCRAAVAEPDRLTPFLWRLEESRFDEPPVLLVQAAQPLNWRALPADFALAIDQRTWQPEAVLVEGRKVRFRVRANPTVSRVPMAAAGTSHSTQPARGRRKRLGLRSEQEQSHWIHRQCQRLGLTDVSAEVVGSEMIQSRRKSERCITVCAALFEGVGTITDPAALAAGLRVGIGHARMLGLGLVSVAPLTL